MCVVISELNGILLYFHIVESLYMLTRYLLAISLVYSIARIIKTEEDLFSLCKIICLGTIFSSLLLILSSLPFSRNIVHQFVFSNPFLTPVEMKSLDESVQRGVTLIGTPNISGAFINAMIPYSMLLFLWSQKIRTKWKYLAGCCLIIAPIAVTFGYSRGTLLGLIILMLGFYLYGKGKIRRYILIPIIAIFFFLVGAWNNSEYFMFSRIEKRTTAMLEDPYSSEMESERVDSFTEPFLFLLERPSFLLFGEGAAGHRLARRQSIESRVYDEGEAATHSVFAKSFYSFGGIASFTLLFLIAANIISLLTKISFIERLSKNSSYLMKIGLISFFTILPWYLTAHGMVTNPRGFMFFFVVLGLSIATVNVTALSTNISKK